MNESDRHKCVLCAFATVSSKDAHEIVHLVSHKTTRQEKKKKRVGNIFKIDIIENSDFKNTLNFIGSFFLFCF